MPFEPTFTPTVDDIQAWQSQPVSRWYFAEVKRMIEEKNAYMGTGNCLVSGDMAKTYEENARTVGHIAGLQAALDAGTMVFSRLPEKK